MANPNRKMCTMRQVSKVEAIENADNIVAYHVDGWVVVDKKGAFKEGDYVLFYEIDTFMPTDDPMYGWLASRGEKTMTVDGKPVVGHVLKTARLRGVYSQGLIMDPHEVLPKLPEDAYQRLAEGRNRLDEMVGVWEYHPDQNSLAAGFIAKYDSYVAPRTDAERVQNVTQDIFDLVKATNYFASVKVDGTSITMVLDPRANKVRAFSHNNEFDVEQGQGKLVMETAKSQGLVGWLEAHPGVSLQMELCGPKIGGNALRLKGYRLFVFSAWDMSFAKYVNPYSLMPKQCTPMLKGFDLSAIDTTEGLLAYAENMRGNVTKDALDEGLVIHVLGRGMLDDDEWMVLCNELGAQMQLKAVSNRFLAKKAKKK